LKTIYFEGSILSMQKASGISNYVVNLMKYFRQHQSHFGLVIKLLVRPDYSKNLFLMKENALKSDFIELSNRQFYKTMFMPTKLLKDIDLLHSPYMFLPLKQQYPINVLTIHDLINFERSFSVRNRVREVLLRNAVGKAEYYICVSRATQELFMQHFPSVRPERIFIIPQGIDPLYIDSADFADNSTIIPEFPYILYVGNRIGYKNFDFLLQFLSVSAWAKKIKLLCVGGGPFTKAELTRIHKLGISDVVKHAGYIESGDLKTLYKYADALVFPSLMEGFGLPILEAMACRCPVICGDFSAMKEVAKSHAILVSEFTIDALEGALEKIDHFSPYDKEMARNHAIQFSWEKTAIKTLSAYSQILN
jgi:glycosyltransferase involved in cell wall biosynthesis